MDLNLIETIADGLERFIRERFSVPDTDTQFSQQVNLWEEGYVDSLGAVELIAFIESTYTIKLPTSVLFAPDFTTISGMARLTGQLVAQR
jgi:acyl carrier protein